MTELDWQRCEDASVLLAWLESQLLVDSRKLRLFVAGACLLARQHLHPGVVHLLELVEAEVCAGRSQPGRPMGCSSAFHDALLALRHESLSSLDEEARSLACWILHGVSKANHCAAAVRYLCPPLTTEMLAELTRDLFGNPFHKVRQVRGELSARLAAKHAPARAGELLFVRDWLHWNRGLLVQLAQGIEEDRAYDRLPILGDALEEAGCNEPLLLEHCRHAPLHSRGCWVVDLILNRT
jgi:hypothetical protein